MKYKRFVFAGHHLDLAARHVRLRWFYADGPAFEEVFEFPGAPAELPDDRLAALHRACALLGQVAGVSYYKAFLPPQLAFDDGVPTPTPARAQFLNRLYRHGLAEFAYENGQSLAGRIHFPQDDSPPEAPSVLDWSDRVAVPVGGGKDSIVSIEVARSLAGPLCAMQVGRSPLIRSVIEVGGLPCIQIQRTLSANLKALNAKGALNGHVPVTAILSVAFLVASIWHDIGTVVMSNERSANVGNLVDDAGFEVNHQYSKSLDFEAELVQLVASEVVKGWRYFSLLRPLSEIAIARLFSRWPHYFSVFSSCNRNFHLDGSRTQGRWCRNCPKCRFVFLALANFVERQTLVDAFGGNLLDDDAQAAGFDALIGADQHKPFECVGELEESHSALDALADHADWAGDRLIQRYLQELRMRLPPARPLSSHMALDAHHRVPADWLARLQAHAQ